MRREIIIASILLLAISTSWAQENGEQTPKDTSYWRNNAKAGADFNQSFISQSWTGGGNSAISFSAFLNAKAKYAKDNISFISALELLYGTQRLSNSGDAGGRTSAVRKTQDKIFLNNKLGYDINPKWDANFNLQFLTQFDDGFRYPDDDSRLLISSFLAPAFITASLGLAYKPADIFTLQLSPLSPRITVTYNQDRLDSTIIKDNRYYGVDAGETFRFEWYAFQLVADYDHNVNENLSVSARYQMFANYEELQPNLIDHRLDMTITSRVTEYITVNINLISIYDFDQSDKIQLSQALGVGLLFNLIE